MNNYSEIKKSLPHIRLKNLKKSHHQIEQEQKEEQVRLGLSEKKSIIKDYPELKQYFVNKSKGGNKKYKIINSYENDIILMKPQVDASDKEIFKRNGMAGAAEQLKNLVYAKERIIAQENTFLPSKFAQHSEPKTVIKKVIKNQIMDEENQTNEAQDINKALIIKRKVENLYQQLGQKLMATLNHRTIRMNPKLFDFLGSDIVLITSMTDVEKEKKIKQYLHEMLSQEVKQEEILRQHLENINEEDEKEQQESDEPHSERQKSTSKNKKLSRLQTKKSTNFFRGNYYDPRRDDDSPMTKRGSEDELSVDSQNLHQTKTEIQSNVEQQGFQFVKLLSEQEQKDIKEKKIQLENKEKQRIQKEKAIKTIAVQANQQDKIDMILKDREKREARQAMIRAKAKAYYKKKGNPNDDDSELSEFNSYYEEEVEEDGSVEQIHIPEKEEKKVEQDNNQPQIITINENTESIVGLRGDLLLTDSKISSSLAQNYQQTILAKKKRRQKKFEKESEHLDYQINHENAIIERVSSMLESNLKNSIGTGLNKSLYSLIALSQDKEENPDHIPGLMHNEYRRNLKNLQQQATDLDDLFLSRNGVKVMPERKKRRNDDEGLINMREETLLEKNFQRRKEIGQLMAQNVDREVAKIKLGLNRDFLRELEMPQNEIEAEVNKKIKIELRKMKHQMLAEKQEDKKGIKKLPLIDDMKFDNMQLKSLAQKKRMWKGKKGKFKIKDLSKWFKVYDETKLFELRKQLKNKKPEDEFNFN